MICYDITHTTVYRYKTRVTFGEHRVMFRPRDSHDLRVLATDLAVSPMAHVRLIQDPHSNSVALVQPLVAATELRIVCTFTIEHAHTSNLELPLSPEAELFPFAYSVQDRFDLELYLRPHYEDPQGKLADWTRQFIRTDGPTRVRDMLVQMNQTIRDQLRYEVRDEEGTQTPLQTLALGSGTCRGLRAADDGSGAAAGHRDALRLRLPVRPRARHRRCHGGGAPPRSAPAARTPGCRPTCPARAGCRSTRPTTCSAAAS